MVAQLMVAQLTVAQLTAAQLMGVGITVAQLTAVWLTVPAAWTRWSFTNVSTVALSLRAIVTATVTCALTAARCTRT